MEYVVLREADLENLRLVFELVYLNLGVDPVGDLFVNLLIPQVRTPRDGILIKLIWHELFLCVVNLHI